MQSSARRGIQYPSLDRSDKPDIPAHVKNLIDALELDVASSQGLLSARAANPGFARQVYWGTDTHLLYYWDGSAWFTVGTSDVIAGSSINAKGDLIVGLANDTPGILSVGSNGFTLQADNGQSQGMKWARDAVIDLMAAKGDLIAGLAADSIGRVAAGADGQMLISDSGQAAGLKWGAPVLPVVTAALTGNQALTSGSFVDVLGVSLAAGTWVIISQSAFSVSNSNDIITIRINDGTTTFSSAEPATRDVRTGVLFAVVTPGSTIAYKLQARAATTGSTALAQTATSAQGNTATQMIAVRIA